MPPMAKAPRVWQTAAAGSALPLALPGRCSRLQTHGASDAASPQNTTASTINRSQTDGWARGSNALLTGQPDGASCTISVFLSTAIQISPLCTPIAQASELVVQ